MNLQSMDQFMSIIMVIAGLMSFYYAITGKGKVFENDYPKEMKEDANKLLRNFLWLIGPFALISGILQLIGYAWAYWISLVVLPEIVVYYIIFRKRFKQYLKKMK